EKNKGKTRLGLADGSDIGPNRYSPNTTVGSLKEMLLSQLPKDEENGPKTINDMKLINAGKILENHKTLAESRSPVSEVPGGVITMLVVTPCMMAPQNRAAARVRFSDHKTKRAGLGSCYVNFKIDFRCILLRIKFQNGSVVL
ncbi:hypothetical protein M8C21_033531, partial [Ambrosia artemisiifolia]